MLTPRTVTRRFARMHGDDRAATAAPRSATSVTITRLPLDMPLPGYTFQGHTTLCMGDGSMSLVDRMIAATQRALPTEDAAAHCDVPCGIYDPHAAQIAAHTVIRMVDLIEGLGELNETAKLHTFNRHVAGQGRARQDRRARDHHPLDGLLPPRARRAVPEPARPGLEDLQADLDGQAADQQAGRAGPAGGRPADRRDLLGDQGRPDEAGAVRPADRRRDRPAGPRLSE